MGFCTWRPGAVHATRRAAQRVGGSALGPRRLPPGFPLGTPPLGRLRDTSDASGCRTDPIVKTIEHFGGGIPACSVRCSRSRDPSRAPAPARRAHAGRGTRRVRPRASSAVSHKRRWVDDGVTPGRPAPGRATILSVPVFAPTWGLLAARPPPPDTRWPLWRGARCGASLR